MEQRDYGSTDMKVSILGFGGAEIGNQDQQTVDRLLNGALHAGLNLIDTAECYGNSEELIGKALAGRRNEYTYSLSVGIPQAWTLQIGTVTAGAEY